MKQIGRLFLICSFLVGTPALAGFYVEPGITYERGDNEMSWSSPLTDSTGDSNGLGVNLKLGMHVKDSFFVGLDGSYSQPKFTHSATDYSADSTSTLYGAIIGGQMPVAGLRIWAGYIFGGELDPKSSGGYDVKFQEASGPKVGVGLKLLAVSINLEYMDLTYNKTIIQQAGPLSADTDKDLKNKLGVLSVSIPLTL